MKFRVRVDDPEQFSAHEYELDAESLDAAKLEGARRSIADDKYGAGVHFGDGKPVRNPTAEDRQSMADTAGVIEAIARYARATYIDGDQKYGRLFTASDVEDMLQTMGQMIARDMEGVTLDSDRLREDIARIMDDDTLTLARDGDPLFLIRGKDAAAPEAIRRYAESAERAGAGPDHVDRADAIADEVADWQRAHPHKVKTPD